MFLYKIEDLFAGLLGYVTKEGRTLYIEDMDSVILFRKKKIKISKYKSDYCAENVFTNQKYFFFHGNEYPYDTIYKAINGYAIMSFIPIETFMHEPKRWITKSELLKLYRDSNTSKQEENIKKELSEPITDNLLKMILETNNLVKNTQLEENFKDYIIQELEQLAEYYVTSLTKLNKSNIPMLSLENNEYQICMECIKRLVEIDYELKNPNHTKNYSLKKQLSQVKKELKS